MGVAGCRLRGARYGVRVTEFEAWQITSDEYRIEKSSFKNFLANLWLRARHVESEFLSLQLYKAPQMVYR